MKTRRSFEGVWNIVRFNWPMYVAAGLAGAAMSSIAASTRLPRWLRVCAALGSAGSTGFTAGSLLVSHWIYDRSRLYRWDWLCEMLGHPPETILNIHAGFDEATGALRKLFPEAELVACDFYDPARNSEPSIARAREAYPPAPGTLRARYDALPASDGWAGLVVGFLALHEIRDAGERRILFREARRAMRTDGRMIVVEHLRDAANFAAFGPGFLHFHSRRTWMHAAGSDFRLVEERSITPFIRVFCFEPA